MGACKPMTILFRWIGLPFRLILAFIALFAMTAVYLFMGLFFRPSALEGCNLTEGYWTSVKDLSKWVVLK